jgi:hypothetical protein
MKRSLIVAVLAALLLAPRWGRSAGEASAPPPSPIYPQETIVLRFSHRAHAAQGIACLRCHAEVPGSESARDRLIPAEARCAGCHEIDKAREDKPASPSGECRICHPGFDPAVHRAPEGDLFPRSALHFSHARHLQAGESCAGCHGTLESVDLATRAALPRMGVCLGCHDGKRAPRTCALCHLSALAAKGARLEVELPAGRLRPGSGDPLGLDHGPRFETGHGLVAQGRREQCLACHAEASCLRCHDGTAKPRSVHPGDWMAVHPVPARMDEPRCDSCHRRQTFCVACHERVGIGSNADLPFRQPAARVHPPDAVWVGIPGPGGRATVGPGHHAVQAARNISQCVSCHREEECLKCHSAAGTPTVSGSAFPSGQTVHPPGFAGACKAMLRKNGRACQKCHTVSPPDADIARCR